MTLTRLKLANPSLARQQKLKEAVLQSFYCPASEVESRLVEFRLCDWEKILFWIDISGLALYLLDRLSQLNLKGLLPEPIVLRFERNLRENRERTTDLFREQSAIVEEMRLQNVSFALLKGISLFPDSVPDPALRWQVDLDFLVANRDEKVVKRILHDFGYLLHAVSGDTLEFKAGKLGKPDIRNIYRTHSQRSVEIHLLAVTQSRQGSQSNQLSRAITRSFDGVAIPCLSPSDIFVQQGLHLFKHLCGEHTRASWLLEFWRHAKAREHDVAFWREVEMLAMEDPHARIALGASVMLASRLFGNFPHDAVKDWAVGCLPAGVRFWIEAYGARSILASTPGNKLYLILRKQLEKGREFEAEVRRLVLPTHLPPPITRGEAGESLAKRVGRYRVEAGYVCSRLHFHLWEGLKYLIESGRWQRRAQGTVR